VLFILIVVTKTPLIRGVFFILVESPDDRYSGEAGL